MWWRVAARVMASDVATSVFIFTLFLFIPLALRLAYVREHPPTPRRTPRALIAVELRAVDDEVSLRRALFAVKAKRRGTSLLGVREIPPSLL